MQKLSIQELSVKNQRVLMRVDFNVPLTEQGTIADLSRIEASLPSIRWVLENGGSVILMSHLGRPKGKKESRFSLRPCAQALEKLLGSPVQMASDCIGKEVKEKALSLTNGQVLLLENLRFYPAEEKPELDPTFAEQLSELGTLYVNDAFGTTHRNHSSIGPITAFFPHHAAAGFLLQKEIAALSQLLDHPQSPFYLLLGGAKISSKIGVLKNLAPKTNGVFIGGAMAFTFLKAQGKSIGDSLCEADAIDTALQFLKQCEQSRIPIFLPCDLVIANAFSEGANFKTIDVNEGIPAGWQGMDIGPKTCEQWAKIISNSKTIFWNGPFGVFEMAPFAKGTYAIASTIAALKESVTIVGGGDSLSAINQMHLESHFSHLSTGGGASLEYLEFGHLPGIDALSDETLAL